MDPLIDPGEYAALAYCTYLNQASLGLIPRASVEASVRFLTDVAQHGNLRLSDQAEARVLDGLRTAAAELLGAPVTSVAVVGGASEGLGQLAALLSSAGGGGEAGAAPVTMTQWGVDALVCSGYKWLSAPSGVALLAITENLAAATPVIVGWKGSATPFDFTPQELSLAADARRFELSTMSYSAAVGLPHVDQAAHRHRADGDQRARQPAGGRSGRADRAAGMGALPGARRAFRKRAHRLAQPPRCRGRPGAGRAGEPAQHPHQLSRSTARSVTTTRMPSWPLPRC